ncbi:hypothetical protein LINPERPRIM_LOCUS38575, partial [Linum perenne]
TDNSTESKTSTESSISSLATPPPFSITVTYTRERGFPIRRTHSLPRGEPIRIRTRGSRSPTARSRRRWI